MIPELPAAAGPHEDDGQDFAGQVTALLEAAGPDEMTEAARWLRGTVLAAHRVLAGPGGAGRLAGPGASKYNVARCEVDARYLADLAVDVITGLDYLLVLLAPVMPPERLYGSYAREAEDAAVQRSARQLDARAAAVRQCSRFLDKVTTAATR